MLSFNFKLLLGQLIVSACCASAQQFAGTPINNSLAAVPTSEVAFWNIYDSSNKSTTLINYSSLSKSNTRLDVSQVERAVIVVHGLDRDPWNYMSEAIAALQTLSGPSVVNQNTVQIVAPYFTSGSDKGVAYPWNTSAPAGGRGSYTNALVWYGSTWINGANNQYPYKQQLTSSYAVLDTMIQYFDNKTLYPNLKQIVLAGHSAGAQTLHRYAAVGNVLNTITPVSLWIANPDSYLWFSATRPFDTSECPTYDVWRDGLSNYTNTYGANLVAQGRSAVLARYNARQINYARGTLDTGEDSSTCAPFTTGANRNERFFQFIKAFPPTCTKGGPCDTIDYVPVGHDAGMMMSSSAGQSRLFLDNWSGNGSQAYDYGCPRLQVGDNPWPNPKCTQTVTPADKGTYNGYTYVGCYSDDAFFRTLPYTAYSLNSNATIKSCIAACAAANYTLAGAEFGDECYCGDSMYWATSGPLPEQSCTMNCTGVGNASQICGDSARLSVFSKNAKAPVVAKTPVAPATAKNWAFEGCYTELASGGRSLSGPSTQSTAMTLETCVSFCSSQGYTIAGTEYAAQCYCGTYLPTGANSTYTPECNMPCSGNATQFCGGPSLLSVYANPNYWGTNLTMNVSSSSTSAASTTTSAALVAATGALSCPGSNGLGYTSGGSTWAIECFNDRAGSDLGLAYTATLEACIATCATTSGCVDISWVPGTASTSPCYMKSAINALQPNNAVWGARYYGRSNSSIVTTTSSGNWSYTGTSSSTIAKNTSIASTSSVTTVLSSTITSSASLSSATGFTSVATSTKSTSYIVAATPISCPASNNETYTTGSLIFLLECYTDRPGGDISMQYTTSYSGCADTCANTTGCIDFSWVSQTPNGPCYMKSQINPTGTNTAVWGARVIGTATAVASSSKLTFSTTSTSSISTTTSSSSITMSSSSKVANTTSVISTSSSSSSSSSSTTSTSATSTLYSSSTLSTVRTSSNGTTSTSQTSSTSIKSSTLSTASSSKTSSSSTSSKAATTTKISSTTSKVSGTSKPSSSSSSSTSAAATGLIVRQSYSNWTMQGCYSDNSTHVTLPKNVTVLGGSTNMTIPNCLSACAKGNYTWCGAENSTLCYGATTAPSTTLRLQPTASPVAAGCNVACSGNKTEVCGGLSQLIVYKL